MALLLPVKGIAPHIGSNCFLAPTATLVGDIVTGSECSFWFNTVVRGDVNAIRIGNRVNIQDNAVIHCTYQKAATTIGNNVSVGHGAIVHGCTIHDNVLIGMGAIIMDHCTVESGSIIAAGAVLTEGTHVPSGVIYAGIPAKKIREVSPELFRGEVERIAQNYVLYASWFKDVL